MFESATIGLLRERASVRDFASRGLDDDTMTRLLQAACRAPTSDNLQAYSFVVVRDAGKRRTLARLAGNQAHVASAPVVVAVCADLARVEAACHKQQQYLTRVSLELGLVAAIDGALAAMALCMAAESIGLGTVMIGGMRNHPVEVAELLDLPPRVFVTFGLCIGWPRVVPAQQPRLPLRALVFNEQYDAAAVSDGIDAHDAATATQRAGEGPGDVASWSTDVATFVVRDRRHHLAADLRRLGLTFE